MANNLVLDGGQNLYFFMVLGAHDGISYMDSMGFFHTFVECFQPLDFCISTTKFLEPLHENASLVIQSDLFGMIK